MVSGILSVFRKQFTWRLLLWTVFPFLLSACFSGEQQKVNDKNGNGEKKSATDDIQQSKISVSNNLTFNLFLDDLDKSNPESVNRALSVFNRCDADSLSRDSMLVSFEEFITSVTRTYYENKLVNNPKLADQSENGEDQPEVKKMVGNLASHGIILTCREREFYLEPDYSFLHQHLKDVLSTASRSYLQIKSIIAGTDKTEKSEHLSPPDSLAVQVIAWEDFMRKHPDYILTNEILAQYIDAMSAYLSGMEQFPLFDPETKVAVNQYRESYLRLINNYPDRSATQIVKRFYDLLSSKSFKYDEEVDTFLSEVNFIPTQNQQ